MRINFLLSAQSEKNQTTQQKKNTDITTMPLIDVNTTTEFDSQITKKPFTVIHFWADWCTPCTDIDKFLLQLESQLNNGKYITIIYV